MESTFYNDPSFPAPPAGVTFTGPVLNTGPDADMIRDTADGKIKDANSIGRDMGTFTPHSSPVGLTFDTELQLGGDYNGKGFALSYNASSRRKYTPFLDPGGDILMLELTKTQDNYITSVTRIAQGFSGPLDAVIVGNRMYLLEYDGRAIWEITFPTTGVGIDKPSGSISPLISVYPNPVSAEVRLSASFTALFFKEVKLYDLSGKLLKRFDVEAQKSNPFSFSVDDLATGVYFVQVLTNKGIALKKVLKE